MKSNSWLTAVGESLDLDAVERAVVSSIAQRWDGDRIAPSVNDLARITSRDRLAILIPRLEAAGFLHLVGYDDGQRKFRRLAIPAAPAERAA